jgi:hypothetical protein
MKEVSSKYMCQIISLLALLIFAEILSIIPCENDNTSLIKVFTGPLALTGSILTTKYFKKIFSKSRIKSE